MCLPWELLCMLSRKAQWPFFRLCPPPVLRGADVYTPMVSYSLPCLFFRYVFLLTLGCEDSRRAVFGSHSPTHRCWPLPSSWFLDGQASSLFSSFPCSFNSWPTILSTWSARHASASCYINGTANPLTFQMLLICSSRTWTLEEWSFQEGWSLTSCSICVLVRAVLAMGAVAGWCKTQHSTTKPFWVLCTYCNGHSEIRDLPHKNACCCVSAVFGTYEVPTKKLLALKYLHHLHQTLSDNRRAANLYWHYCMFAEGECISLEPNTDYPVKPFLLT